MSGTGENSSSSGGGGSGEDDLESSLQPLQTMAKDFNAALEDFRANWEKELKQKQTPSQPNETVEKAEVENTESPVSGKDEVEQEALAKSLFQKAVELEQRGKVYDAVPLYRKAVQLDPNIELKFYEHQKLKNSIQPNQAKEIRSENAASEVHMQAADDVADEDTVDDLYEKFQMDLSRNYNGKLIMSSRDPGIITTEMHISELPPEILLYIMRWVVSSQLDMRSLEQCAAVCKGMYLVARDEELWRTACVKVWGPNTGNLIHSEADEENPPPLDEHCPVIPQYLNWRQMFIDRERVLLSGCYISKTTYLRMGENSFQDQFYRPVQLVEYYRYLRFLADGTVIMMTSADEPQQCVTRLKNVKQLRQDILRGHYRLFGSTLSIVLNKQQQQSKFITGNAAGAYNRHRRGSSVYDDASMNSTKYCIEFRIMHKANRKFAQLVWLHYSVVQVRNKHETTSDFDLTSSKYPPLWFSPVKSYHLDADTPLT